MQSKFKNASKNAKRMSKISIPPPPPMAIIKQKESLSSEGGIDFLRGMNLEEKKPNFEPPQLQSAAKPVRKVEEAAAPSEPSFLERLKARRAARMKT